MKKAKKIVALLLVLPGMAVGGAAGYILASHSEGLGEMLVGFAALLAAIYAQVILHEAGHLLAGLLTGYRFVSFRVGSLMLLRSRGRYRLCRYRLAGTGGQCLMAPPPMVEGEYPCFLYHLGGALMNFMWALLAAAMLLMGGYSAWWLGTLLFGVFMTITNGVPLRLGQMDNDGRNALRSLREESVRTGFYRQIQINAALTEGQRLRDMPAAWFDCGEGQEYERGYLHLARLMDEGSYEAAREWAGHLLECDLPGIHRGFAESEARCLALLAGERPPEPSRQLLQLQRAMGKNPAMIRAAYVAALLEERDKDKAALLQRRFDRAARGYPYPGDVQTDMEIMRFANDIAKEEMSDGGIRKEGVSAAEGTGL